MVFLWLLYGIYMVFIWYSIGFQGHFKGYSWDMNGILHTIHVPRISLEIPLENIYIYIILEIEEYHRDIGKLLRFHGMVP